MDIVVAFQIKGSYSSGIAASLQVKFFWKFVYILLTSEIPDIYFFNQKSFIFREQTSIVKANVLGGGA